MKIVNLFYIYFTILGITISSLSSCDNQRSSQNGKEAEEKIVKQETAKGLFAGDQARTLLKAIKNSPYTKSAGEEYPDFFEGIYLDKDFNINAVISDDNLEKYKSFIEEEVKTVRVFLRKGDFSFNELKQAQKRLDYFLSNQAPKDIRDNFISAGLNEEVNRICIELKDINPRKINEFRSTFEDSPTFLFKQGTSVPVDVKAL